MISYKNLFKIMIDRDLTRKDVAKIANIAPSTLSRMASGEAVNMSVVEKICIALGLGIENVVEIIPDEPICPEAGTPDTEGQREGR